MTTNFPHGVYSYGAPVLSGLPVTGQSKYYWLDCALGNDNNDGLTPGSALKSLSAAEDKCVGDQHDAVLLIPSDTSDSTATTITWDKDHTHLIGMGAPFPGIGQRCRINSTAAAPALTITGKGGIFKGFQVQNSYAGASGGVLVSGIYNYFENVYFNGMNNASSANQAASYCLTLSGAENYLRGCTIGSVQLAMSSTNAPLIISTGANTFEKCRIQHYSETAGNFLVSLSAGTAGMSLLLFDGCVFFNQTVNWAAGSTDVFNIAQTGSHYVLLKDCIMIGATSWADVVTHVYHDKAAPATGGGIAIAVNA
jgi:hypothetical protein